MNKTLELLKQARKYVEQEVIMVADLQRFAPLPESDQEEHNSKVYPCEQLLEEIDQHLGEITNGEQNT